MEERRWRKTNALWCACMPTFTRPASFNLPLLQARTLTRRTQINGSAMLECWTTLISSGAPMVRTPAFGAIMLPMLPTSLSSPVLSIDLLVELLACGLTFVFRHLSLHDFQRPWIQGTCSSLENFCSLASWWRSLVPPWDCE